MPLAIINQHLYEDRTVQNWHRTVFPRDSWAIDLDLMGACSRCRAPLYLIESTTNPQKPLSILKSLAMRARLPALVIQHDTNIIVCGIVIYPERARLEGEQQVHDFLSLVRQIHVDEGCK